MGSAFPHNALLDAVGGAPSFFQLERWWTLSADPWCVVGTDRVVRAVNPAWERVVGGAGCDSVLRRLPLTGERDRFEGVESRCMRADGSPLWLLWSGVRDDGAWYCIGKDITEQKRDALRQRRADRAANAHVRGVRDGLCEIDVMGRIADVNDRLCAMTGFTPGELIGARAPYPFWPVDRHDELAAALAADLAEGGGHRDLVFCRKDGGRFPVTVDASSSAGTGRRSALTCVVRDLAAEQQERERLREAHRVARLASWQYDPGTQSVQFSLEAWDTAGVDLGDCPELSDVLELFTVPDAERLREALAGVAAGEVEEAVVECPIGVPNADLQWVETRMRTDGRGGVRGTTQDITSRKLAEIALERSEERLSQAQRLAGIGSFEVDYATEKITWSAELYRLFAVDPATFSRDLADVRAMMPPADAAAVRQAAEGTLMDGRPRELQHRYLRGAEVRWAEMRLEPMSARAVRGTMQDITDRKRAQLEVEVQAQLLDAVDVAVIATDLEGTVTHWNRGAERLYGWMRDEARGRPVTELTVGPADAALAERIMRSVRERGQWEGEFEVRRKDGSSFPAYVRDAVFAGADGAPAGVVGVSVDMTERVETERTLRAARDYERAITASMGEGLYTVDADGRLLYMNPAAEDLLGWRHAELIGQPMHDVIHFRRPDGAPFPAEACPLLDTRRRGRVTRVDDDTFVRRDGTDLPVAYTSAPFDTADGVRGCVVVFSDISERMGNERRLREQMERLEWVGRIRDALAEDRFVLFAQPIVDVRTGDVVQHELLIRMRDREGVLVPPGKFLPAAEEYGLIVDVDRWVVREAMEFASRGCAVELNLSARSVATAGMADHFRQELQRTGADPSLIVVELTETALLEDGQAAERFIGAIKSLGCRLALDDFGTGYGGFTYLKRLPVDYLKIDIEFVRDLPDNAASRQVVQAVVSLAKGFGQTTVAEGVEDERTLELLREIGVHCAQGYGIARPAPAIEALEA